MPGSSNNSSFIPKRGTTKRTRKVRNANIYLLNIASYVLLFAALIASAGVFFYSGYVREQFNEEVATMSQAVKNFEEAEMQQVQEFDIRLRQANQRLNNSASVTKILETIEDSVIDTVRFNQLSLEREMDTTYTIEVIADTDVFDSAIFQRDTLEGNEYIQSLEISNFSLEQTITEDSQVAGQSVALIANILVPVSAVPYEAPSNDSTDSQPAATTAPDEVGIEAEAAAEEAETLPADSENDV